MSGSSGDKKMERRSSSAGTTSTNSRQLTRKEEKRPLTAVLSEDRVSMAPQQAANTSRRQFDPVNLEMPNQYNEGSSGSGLKDENNDTKSPATTSNISYRQLTAEGGRVTKSDISNSTNDLDHDESKAATKIKQMTEESAHHVEQNKPCDAKEANNNNALQSSTNIGLDQEGNNKIKEHQEEGEKKKRDEDEDEDNQVIPLWPSRDEAAACNAEFVQRKVYSLKDYSQVASPTVAIPFEASFAGPPTIVAPAPAPATASTYKLLKSMSQDRKLKFGGKRMSECLYSSGAGATVAGSSQQQLHKPRPSVASPSSINQLESVGNLASSGILQTSNNAGESRIDRMRKLFVSPLSLRSGNGSGKVAAGGQQQAPGPSARLSFQSGASMLNKPHYLMHAMYRTHHNRRSPMRQKQGKSFRVYGCPLQMANNIYPITCFGRADIYKQKSVPYVLARLCNYIEENSSQLTHEGIFRVSGNARLMEKLRTLFDRLGDAPLETEAVDVATSASMLKMYLRELPEPLIPTRMNYYFISLAKKYSILLTKDNVPGYSSSAPSSSVTELSAESLAASERQRLAFARDLTKLVRKLPVENYNLLKYLACFLYRISLKQHYNKMCAEALGIVFGPNVFRIRSESYKGLKEQELSNQVMASIISNYKSIFDSELTDPLGNVLVHIEEKKKANEEKLVGGDNISSLGFETSAHTEVSGISSGSNTSISAKTPTSSVPVASTSHMSSDLTAGTRGADWCSKHVCDIHTGVAGEIDVEEESEDEEDDDNRESTTMGQKRARRPTDIAGSNESDYECDEPDSYTPSSGSGSYCSSMGSETLESSFDEEAGEELGSTDMASRSSSECVSDTSYTPTSSHSDSETRDDGDNSLYGNSSSFESSPSIGQLIDTTYGDKDNLGHESSKNRLNYKLPERKSCLVCKRRESSANRLLEAPQGTNDTDVQIKAHEGAQGQSLNEADGNQIASSSTTSHTQLAGERVSGSNLNPESECANDASNVQQQQRAARPSSSRRQKQAHHENPIKEPGQDVNLETADNDGLTSAISRADRSTEQNKKLLVRICQGQPVKGVKPVSKHQAVRQARKLDFFRRRSSSASSLGRMKHRCEQTLASHARDEASGPRHKTKGTPESNKRSRFHDTRGHNSSRRIRGNHFVRKTTADSAATGDSTPHQHQHQHQHHHHHYQTHDSNQTARASRRHRSRNLFGESRIKTKQSGGSSSSTLKAHSSAHNNDDEQYFGWDFLSAQYMEELENDRYFLLRSFNSDETLLRSLNYNTEFSKTVGPTKQRRRFSGHDFDNKLSLTARACQPCDQIYEAFEEDALLGLITPEQIYPIDPLTSAGIEVSGQNSGQAQSIAGQQPVEPLSFGASSISLIDNRSIGSFRKSEISFNEAANRAGGEDPILTQMKATKELIRILRRHLKLGSALGYSKEVESLVLKLSEDPNALCYADDCTTSYIDYLSTQNLTKQLDKLLEQANCKAKENIIINEEEKKRENSKIDQLNGLLSIKITLFKQRYNDLKNIRYHYVKNHAHRMDDLLPKREVRNDEDNGLNRKASIRVHGSLDTLRSNSERASNSMTSCHRHRLLSVPNKEHLFAGRRSASSKATLSPPELTEENKSESARDLVVLSSPQNIQRASSRKEPDRHRQGNTTDCQLKQGGCQFGSLCPVEFVFNIEKQLAFKRALGARLIDLNSMSFDQLQSEKLELQKNLLRYEHWFGRPVTRLEFSLVGHLYERYRAVKMIKNRKQRKSEEAPI